MSPVRYTEDGPLVVAHRGGAGLRPENTLAAFACSVSLGVLWLESDVRASADGVAVLHHDRTLARLFGLDVAVADLTWDQLRSLRTRDGDRLVRPADVLGTFPSARLAVDLKDPAVVPGLLADVRRTGSASRVCLAGAPDPLLRAAAAAEPG
ncbi:glycerophosphodiester phosphodiesterase, partial [Aquipuribacter hungaricus]